MAKRVTYSIDVSAGGQSLVLNTRAHDGAKVSIAAYEDGLNGTGIDLDFYETQFSDAAFGDVKGALTGASGTIASGQGYGEAGRLHSRFGRSHS